MNYDDELIGVNNPLHPANEIDVVLLTAEEEKIQELEMAIRELQRINSNLIRIASENGIHLKGKNVDQYIKLQERFNFKLNQI